MNTRFLFDHSSNPTDANPTDYEFRIIIMEDNFLKHTRYEDI